MFFANTILFFAAAGCSPLPRGSHTVAVPWKNYDEVKTAFDTIEINKTTREDLKRIFFDPKTQPNISIMSYLDVMQRFLVNPSIRKEDLDVGLQACIGASTRCTAYQMDINNTTYIRFGNFFMDLLTFSRSTREEGWKFNAIVVLVDDTVVYKLSAGTPNIDVDDYSVKPLGPAQNLGESPPVMLPH